MKDVQLNSDAENHSPMSKYEHVHGHMYIVYHLTFTFMNVHKFAFFLLA